ncbi:MAG: ArsR/SmtB family transcription factor [Anaerolineae bacterium]
MGQGEGIKDRCEVTVIDEAKVQRAEEDLIDGLTATRLAGTFKALSDPTRVRIISVLSHAELCVCDIAAALGMSQSAVSHQLRTLREMRLVRNRREGRMVYYRLDDEHIHDLFHRGLEHVEHV